jgi:hypothetical protein
MGRTEAWDVENGLQAPMDVPRPGDRSDLQGDCVQAEFELIP